MQYKWPLSTRLSVCDSVPPEALRAARNVHWSSCVSSVLCCPQCLARRAAMHTQRLGTVVCASRSRGAVVRSQLVVLPLVWCRAQSGGDVLPSPRAGRVVLLVVVYGHTARYMIMHSSRVRLSPSVVRRSPCHAAPAAAPPRRWTPTWSSRACQTGRARCAKGRLHIKP